MSRIRLGDMLVQAQMLKPQHVDEALAVQKERGGRLGGILVELGYVSEMQLAQVLSNQLSVPWVNLYHVDFSRDLLNLVPAELAEKYSLVPVYVRKVRKSGDTLFVATDDPLNDAALSAISQHVSMPGRHSQSTLAIQRELSDAAKQRSPFSGSRTGGFFPLFTTSPHYIV